MKFRKKPVVIDAFQFKGWTGSQHYFPDWFPVDGNQIKEAVGIYLFLPDLEQNGPRSDVACIIRTLEGDIRADVNDWIIRGVKGEVYPCKPDIFAMTYESVDEEAS